MDFQKTDAVTFLSGLADASVDCVMIDPPYMYLKHRLDAVWDVAAVFNHFKRILRKSGMIVLFGRGSSFYDQNTRLVALGFRFLEEIVWDKGYGSSPVTPLYRKHETISIHGGRDAKIRPVRVPYLEAKRYNTERICNDMQHFAARIKHPEHFQKVIDYLRGVSEFENTRLAGSITVSKGLRQRSRAETGIKVVVEGSKECSIIKAVPEHYRYVHPTQKPVDLLVRLLNLTTDAGDTVVDCFAGSGSTGVACQKTGRTFAGCEIDDEYYNSACKRLGISDIDDLI